MTTTRDAEDVVNGTPLDGEGHDALVERVRRAMVKAYDEGFEEALGEEGGD